MDEEPVSRCGYCGDVIDYCQGHGEEERAEYGFEIDSDEYDERKERFEAEAEAEAEADALRLTAHQLSHQCNYTHAIIQFNTYPHPAGCGALAGSLVPLHPRKEEQQIIKVPLVLPSQLV